MAQDVTYQTKVYHDRPGDRYVAASGGTFAVESMGSLAIYSGAQMTIESGVNLELAGANLAGDDMRRLLVSEWGVAVEIGTGTTLATESVLATKNLPKNARVVTILGATSASQASFWMTSVSAGREVFLRLVGDSIGTFGANNTRVSVNASGCIILNSLGGAVATLTMYTSTNSNCLIHFIAPYDNVWAVVSELGKVAG